MKKEIEQLYIDAINEDKAPNVFANEILEIFGKEIDRRAEKFDKLSRKENGFKKTFYESSCNSFVVFRMIINNEKNTPST